MKLQCKLCGHIVEVKEPVAGAVMMVTHVQARHQKVGLAAINAISAYLSTYFFDPLVTDPITDSTHLFEQYKETKKTLLQGFREWAKGGIK